MMSRRLAFCILAILFLPSCSSTTGNTSSATANTEEPKISEQFSQLDGNQIREIVIGNSLVGISNNFPQVGKIEFAVYYAPDGIKKDRLKFRRGGNIDRSIGTWTIADEQEGILCGTAAKRSQGKARCARIFVLNDQFRTEPTEPSRKGVTGRIVPGDQVN